ncbi:hypothetical protein KY320_03940 [Candidatus Woesearchaeota archaeon]|nr:hypothetical protein [Candidatus Woesearchaeota archaeon]
MRMKVELKVAILMLLLIILSYVGFSVECGNGACDNSETYLLCPEDCPSGGYDNYCDKIEDRICDPDCTNDDPDCAGFQAAKTNRGGAAGGGNNSAIVVVLLVFIAAVIGVVLFLTHRQKEKGYIARAEANLKGKVKRYSPYNLPNSKRNYAEEMTRYDKSNEKADPFAKYKYMMKK